MPSSPHLTGEKVRSKSHQQVKDSERDTHAGMCMLFVIPQQDVIYPLGCDSLARYHLLRHISP